jgi:hypothetical protein
MEYVFPASTLALSFGLEIGIWNALFVQEREDGGLLIDRRRKEQQHASRRCVSHGSWPQVSRT